MSKAEEHQVCIDWQFTSLTKQMCHYKWRVCFQKRALWSGLIKLVFVGVLPQHSKFWQHAMTMLCFSSFLVLSSFKTAWAGGARRTACSWRRPGGLRTTVWSRRETQFSSGFKSASSAFPCFTLLTFSSRILACLVRVTFARISGSLWLF